MGVPLMEAFSEAAEMGSAQPEAKDKKTDRTSPTGKYFFMLSSQVGYAYLRDDE
jgi:hypothetical protein